MAVRAKTAKATGTPEAAGDKKPQATATKFPIEKLAANCRRLFGVSSCVFAGATHGLTGDYTVEEMKSRIEKWKKQEVK